MLTEATSTNAVVSAAAAEPEGLVVVAEHQTAGRGRLDRQWVSPPRAGLTFSVLLKPPSGLRWGRLPLFVAASLAEAIEDVGDIEVRIKWPNDLLVEERKFAGVLIERHGDAAVIGVGVNVTTRADELPIPEATSLALSGAGTTDRETLLVAMLRALNARYLAWQDTGDFGGKSYLRHSATLGQQVQVSLPSGAVISGLATALDDDGGLVVGGHAVNAGDVVHLRLA